MEFCDACGAAMVQIEGRWVCRSCDPDAIPESGPGADRGPAQRQS